MRDSALLILRLVAGGLLAGHGAQKLFGWFGGMGPEGTAGWLESMGLKPGRWWTYAAGAGEFGGGLLTALGFMHPVGPVGAIAASSMATFTAHAKKPIWNAEGGAELPLTNAAVALAVALAGPGKYSLDRMLGLRIPFTLLGLVLSGSTLTVAYGVATSREHMEAQAEAG